MGAYIDALAAIVDEERKVNGARREDWERALELIYAYAHAPIPRLRFVVETQAFSPEWATEPWLEDAAFNDLEDALEYAKAQSGISIMLNYRMRDAHTNEILSQFA